MISFGAPIVGQRVGDDERLQAGQRIERHLADHASVELLDVHAAVMRERHRRRAKARRIGDREIDLVLGRHAGFEGHAIGLGRLVADAVLGEVQPLLFLERGLQVVRAAEQARLALLADAALEHRLDEDLSRCRSIIALISSSLASGPSTSVVGKPTNCSSFAPCNIPVTCMKMSPESRCDKRETGHRATTRRRRTSVASNRCEKRRHAVGVRRGEALVCFMVSDT